MSRSTRYGQDTLSARARSPHPAPLPFLFVRLPRQVVLVCPWRRPAGRGGELAGWQREQLAAAREHVAAAERAGRLPRLAWVAASITPVPAPAPGWLERRMFDGQVVPIAAEPGGLSGPEPATSADTPAL